MNLSSQDAFRQHFSHVAVSETESPEGNYLSIAPIWVGVDRTDVGGWGLGLQHRSLATRLAKAIEAGAAFTSVEVKTDINGKTYVNAAHAVLGRRMNADLKRLGF